MRRHLSWPVLGAGLVLAALVALLQEPLQYTAVMVAAAAGSAACVALGARLSRTPEPWPWLLAAAGFGLLALSDGVRLHAVLGETTLDYPSAADVFRLAAYPLLAAALLAFVRRRTPARDWGAVLDAAIVMVGVGTVLWVAIADAVDAEPTLTLAGKVVTVGYPVADLLLLGLVLRLVVTTGLSVVANGLVALSTVVLLVGDSLYVVGSLHGWYEPGGVIDAVRVMAPVLWAAAAAHGSMRRLTELVTRPESWPTRLRFALLGCAVLATIATVTWEALRANNLTDAMVGASVVLLVLLSARLAAVVVAFERAIARETVLQSGAAALVAAGTRREIRELASETALELAGGKRQAYVQLDLTARPELNVQNAVVVGSGEVAASLRGEIRKAGSLGRLGTARTFIVPILLRGRLEGVVRVTGLRPLAWHLHQGLDTLASQVSLALESVQRGEEMLEQQSEARFRSLVQNSKDLIAVLEPGLTIRYVTPSAGEMLGLEASELVGTHFDRLVHPDEAADVVTLLRDETGQGGRVEQEFRLRHRDGSWRTVECVTSDLLDDPSVHGLVLTAHDVSDRRALEEQLTHQAFHDALTGLPNRALLADRAAHALQRAKRSPSEIALLFLDVDDFKTINDSLGHSAGDELLVEVAARLRRSLREVDTAARLGGDEFAVLLEGADGVAGVSAVADRLLEEVAKPILLGSTQVLMRASIGLVFGEPGQTVGELLRSADIAMYQAKRQGGHRYEIFEPHMHEAALTRLELKADLERAFEDDELDLHYQPLVELQSGRPIGFEALLRWNHPVRGSVSPAEFVPLAEATGLIDEIGAWVLRRACQQTRAWQITVPGCGHLSANVNISARQLLMSGFKDDVVSVLDESGLGAEYLVLEITESTLLTDVDGVATRLAELRDLGVRIAIDDFGTGFSSLGYLQRFPVDELKIAREFVDDVARDPRRGRLVEAILSLAGSLEVETVAEGIEDQAQRLRLQELGCRLGQGFLFSRPVPASDVPNILRGVTVSAA
jgi:diguanylate cyclase (GGDEF)-like protein/PAS domain S-box-containing protein